MTLQLIEALISLQVYEPNEFKKILAENPMTRQEMQEFGKERNALNWCRLPYCNKLPIKSSAKLFFRKRRVGDCIIEASNLVGFCSDLCYVKFSTILDSLPDTDLKTAEAIAESSQSGAASSTISKTPFGSIADGDESSKTTQPTKPIESVDTLLQSMVKNLERVSLSKTATPEELINSMETEHPPSSSRSNLSLANSKKNEQNQSPKPILKSVKNKKKFSNDHKVQFTPDTKPEPKETEQEKKPGAIKFEEIVQMDVVERVNEDSDASLTEEDHDGKQENQRPIVTLLGKNKGNEKKRDNQGGVSMTFLPGALGKENSNLDDIVIHENSDEESNDEKIADEDMDDLTFDDDEYDSTDYDSSNEEEMTLLPPLSLFGSVWTLLNEISTKKTNEYVANRCLGAPLGYSRRKELKYRNEQVYQIFSKQVSTQVTKLIVKYAPKPTGISKHAIVEAVEELCDTVYLDKNRCVLKKPIMNAVSLSICQVLWGDYFQQLYDAENQKNGVSSESWYSSLLICEGLNELKREHIEIFTQLISKGKST